MSNFGSQVKYNFGDHYTNGQQSINAFYTLAQPHILACLLGTVSDLMYLVWQDKSSQTYFHVCSLSWFWFLFCWQSRLDPCLATANVTDVVTGSVVSARECVSQDWSCNDWLVTIYIKINIHNADPSTPVNNRGRSQITRFYNLVFKFLTI